MDLLTYLRPRCKDIHYEIWDAAIEGLGPKTEAGSYHQFYQGNPRTASKLYSGIFEEINDETQNVKDY